MKIGIITNDLCTSSKETYAVKIDDEGKSIEIDCKNKIGAMIIIESLIKNADTDVELLETISVRKELTRPFSELK